MEKFIPYEKLSKKEKRKIDQARRQTWGELNPVTRKPTNSRAYNRNKARNWKREISRTSSGLFYVINPGRKNQYLQWTREYLPPLLLLFLPGVWSEETHL